MDQQHLSPARRAAGVAALAALTLTVASCTATSADPAAGDTDQAAAQAGGTLVYALGSFPGCLDPYQVTQNGVLGVARQVTDSLTDQDPETGEILPWLAESWDTNEDSTSFVFHLRDGVTFSDGTALDAEVVAANFNAIPDLGGRASLPISYIPGFLGAIVVDDSTVQIDFEEPNSQFLQATATISLAILAPATLELTPDERCEPANVIGSGPFTLESYSAEESVVLAKREGYAWGSPWWDSQGEASLDGVEFVILPEASARFGALTSGQIDAMEDVQPQDEAALSAGGYHLVTRANPGVVPSITFNLDNPLFEDAVREAISLAIDREQIVAVRGAAAAFPQSVLASTTPGVGDFSEQFGYEPDVAAELLDDAGWVPGDDGIREKDGQRLSFSIMFFHSPTVQEYLQQALAEVGIELVLNQVTVPDFNALLAERSFEAAQRNLTRADPDVLRTVFTTVGVNPYSIPDSELEALLDDQLAASDADERIEIVMAAQEIILENHWAVPLFEISTVWAAADTVHELKFEASTRMLLHDVWLEQ